MFRIRFHGRGGHGVKTAGRILGTAAFRAGFHAQDSPVYGAERRGAAVASYTRIAREPIDERGVIAWPDLIVLADETLLSDPSAAVLQGVTPHTVLLVNSERPEELLREVTPRPRILGCDMTRRTREILGRAVAISASLAAGAARLLGVIPAEQLDSALHDEFAALGLSEADITKNLQLGHAIFAELPVVAWQSNEPPHDTSPLASVVYLGPRHGAPIVRAPGNAVQRSTGAWRIERPVVDSAHCTRCGLCFVVCPDGAVSLDHEGYPVVDYDHCKGCLLCQRICPVTAIGHQPETRVW